VLILHNYLLHFIFLSLILTVNSFNSYMNKMFYKKITKDYLINDLNKYMIYSPIQILFLIIMIKI